MKGKRVSAVRSSGKHLAVRRKLGQRRAVPRKEDRALVRLLICGVIFVLMVGFKLLFPQMVSELAGSAARIIGGDADFKEAFAAVGRAVSGNASVSDSLQQAYTAVFQPYAEVREDDCRAEGTASQIPETVFVNRTMQLVSVAECDDLQTEMTDDVVSENLGAAAVSDTLMLLTMPDNASLEQRNLGFAYTTPVKGTLTSSFGWREHPVSGGTRFHYGVDLAADVGTDICAFADGTVFATGESSTLGKYIILTHAGGYKTLYAHCSEICRKSGTVMMGEKIAEVGETGETTGPHLHFELQNGKQYLNPIYYVSIG